jgi:hypothetical protein
VPAENQVNLTSAYQREAYAHWTMLHRRSDRAAFAHRWMKLVLE